MIGKIVALIKKTTLVFGLGFLPLTAIQAETVRSEADNPSAGEVVVLKGRRSVTTIPVDKVGNTTASKALQAQKQLGQVHRRAEYQFSRSAPELPVRVRTSTTRLPSSKSKPASVTGQLRAADPLQSKTAHDLFIYDAQILLLHDEDHDGHYSEFEVVVDVDAPSSYADVYVSLYLRRPGGDWEHYFTSDVFHVDGSGSWDDYRIQTRLHEGFPTDDYDLLIDLYEYGYQGIVDTLSPANDGDLAWLPLEDEQHDIWLDGNLTMWDVTTTLLTDRDNDGFYHAFDIEFDLDSRSPQQVFVELWAFDGFQWTLETVTDDMWIDGETNQDAYRIEALWTSGYATEHYNFELRVYDSHTGDEVLVAGTEFGALYHVPLEDRERDKVTNPVSPPPPVSSSHGSGGGAWGWLGLFLIGVWYGRKARKMR